jgi:glutamine synthetase
LRSVEVEFGPSQCEFTFAPTRGLTPADNMVLFRSAVKADRAPPRFSRHLHVPAETAERVSPPAGTCINRWSRARSGENRLHGQGRQRALSPFGRAYLAGLLEHARASTVFTTPTINGYKRYRSYSLAPDRAIWGRDNRGVMIRVLGGPGDCRTRAGKPDRRARGKPYLYMASQILSGSTASTASSIRGRRRTPYETKAALLPKSLREAVFALNDDPFFRRRWAPEFVDYYVHIKNARSSGFRPRYRTGSTANTLRCFEELRSLVIARSAATKQSMPQQAERWIASLRSQ